MNKRVLIALSIAIILAGLIGIMLYKNELEKSNNEVINNTTSEDY